MQLLRSRPRARTHTRVQVNVTRYVVIQIDRTWRARKIKSAVCRLSRVFSSPRVTNVLFIVPYLSLIERNVFRDAARQTRNGLFPFDTVRKRGRFTSNHRIVSSRISRIAFRLFLFFFSFFFSFSFSFSSRDKSLRGDTRRPIKRTGKYVGEIWNGKIEGKRACPRCRTDPENATGCRCRAGARARKPNFHCIRKCICTERPRNEFTRKTALIYVAAFHYAHGSPLLVPVIDKFAKDSHYFSL